MSVLGRKPDLIVIDDNIIVDDPNGYVFVNTDFGDTEARTMAVMTAPRFGMSEIASRYYPIVVGDRTVGGTICGPWHEDHILKDIVSMGYIDIPEANNRHERRKARALKYRRKKPGKRRH
jgi:hypothetical protein